jgi:hypothetical protein
VFDRGGDDWVEVPGSSDFLSLDFQRVSLASEFCLIGAESLLDGDQLCPGFGVGFDQLARTFGQLLLYLNELLLLLSLPGG